MGLSRSLLYQLLRLALAGLIKAGTDLDQEGTELNARKLLLITPLMTIQSTSVTDRQKEQGYLSHVGAEDRNIRYYVSNAERACSAMFTECEAISQADAYDDLQSRVVTVLVLQKQPCHPKDTVVLRAEE